MPRLLTSMFVFGPLALAACDPLGERGQTGECPTGETCSALTPDGLRFGGADLGDQLFTDQLRTARGGTQTIALEYASGATFDLRYRADDAGGASVAVAGTAGANVSVDGVAAGSNWLRIVDPDTGELFDRIVLGSQPIASARLVSTALESRPVDDRRDLALWTTAHGFGVALEDAAHDRLVDEAMTLQLAGAAHPTWDTLVFSARPTVGTATLTVTAGDRPPLDVAVVIVDAVDTIAPIPDANTQPIATHPTLACFEAVAQGRFVSGAPWQFTSDNGTVASGADALFPNCAQITPAHAGTVTITAAIGDVHVATTLPVAAATARFAAPAPVAARPHGLPGERARAFE